MPHNALLFRTVAVLLGFVILAAMPRQADATDDTRTASFDERWQAVPREGGFICGGFGLNAEDGSLRQNEVPHAPQLRACPHERGFGLHPCTLRRIHQFLQGDGGGEKSG